MEKIEAKLTSVKPFLNEYLRRVVFAAEAESIGHGGKALVCKITGISRPTLNQGLKDLHSPQSQSERIRKEGGGRHKITETDPGLMSALESLVEPVSRGDPESALRWTIKSVRTLSEELKRLGHKVGKSKVSILLAELGYSLRSNLKKVEGNQHPDRNAQFEHIDTQAKSYMSNNQPVISVDTKKKELVGNYRNTGKEYRPKNQPREVEDHDFGTEKASPFGIYDLSLNSGFVNVGKNFDTSDFAVNSIRQWWLSMGKEQYPKAKKLMITADSGGSNGYRRKQWKVELQKFANESNLKIMVCHFPPGTSKWNKIEHKLFSQITLNWRGVPLESYETIVQLIGATKTKTGLTVKAQLDETEYQKGVKITDEQLNELNITRRRFHGEWNYFIKPIKT
jgi:Rhodopirellula transposase.